MLIFVIVIRFYIYLTLYLTLRYQICTILGAGEKVRGWLNGIDISRVSRKSYLAYARVCQRQILINDFNGFCEESLYTKKEGARLVRPLCLYTCCLLGLTVDRVDVSLL